MRYFFIILDAKVFSFQLDNCSFVFVAVTVIRGTEDGNDCWQ